MKKFLVIVLAAMMLLTCIACDEGKEPNENNPVTDGPGTTDETKQPDDENKPTGDITMEDVMNHPESPASDFLCDDDGNGGLVLIEYMGSEEIVVIPESINGKPVVTINTFVFANDSPVKGIRLSNSVKEIAEGAFISNVNLKYVVCGSGAETIIDSAFFGCTSLAEVRLNEGLKKIGKQSFSGCQSLKSITIPSSVEHISLGAFRRMSEDFKIIGNAGSVAEAYANSESIAFEAK